MNFLKNFGFAFLVIISLSASLFCKKTTKANEEPAGAVEIKDSVVSRSNVGNHESSENGLAGTKDKCPDCGNIITEQNKSLKCKDCGKRFCNTCESWIDKETEYHSKKYKVRFPLCEPCYEKYALSQKLLIQEDEKKQRMDEEARNKRLEEERKRTPVPAPTPRDATSPSAPWYDRYRENEYHYVCAQCGKRFKAPINLKKPFDIACPWCRTINKVY